MTRKRSSTNWEPEPPDSGWAWVVLVGSFTVNFMAIGFLASVSVYVYVWIDYFDGSAAEVSLVISLCSFMIGIFSPVCSVICTKIGPRLTVMIGAVIMTGGMFVSSYSTSVLFLVISLGLVTALGMSMCVNGNFTGTAKYFKKRLPLAMSISTAGTSVGQLVFPPLYQYLIDQYGWRGSLLIVSALSFNALASGALIRPLKNRRKSPKKKPKSLMEVVAPQPGTSVGKSDTDKYFESNAYGISVLNPSVFANDNFMLSHQTDMTLGSVFEGKADTTTEIVQDEDDIIQYVDSDTWSTRSVEEVTATNTIWAPFAMPPLENPKAVRRRTASSAPTRPRASSMISQTLVKQTSDLPKLVRSASFDVMLLVAMAHGFGWASTTYHLVSRTESINIPADDAALLLTLMGAGSLVGRIIIGMLLDKGLVRPEIGYTLFFSVCSVVTLITPLVTIYGLLVAIALVHGLSSGAATVVIMTAPRLFVKPSLATSATAYVLLAWGVGEISGGVLAGWYYDVLESYDYSFYTAGSLMAVGSALMLVIYFLQQRKRRRHGTRVPDRKDDRFESLSDSFDSELGRSSIDDRGKVNPMYFMRERFDSDTERCQDVELTDNGLGYPEDGGIGDSESQLGASRDLRHADDEAAEDGLGGVRQLLPESFESAQGSTEDQMYGNISADSPYLSRAHLNYAEVHQQTSVVRDGRETPDEVIDSLPQSHGGTTEMDMGFDENNSYGGFENPYSSNQLESGSADEQSRNANKADMVLSRGERQDDSAFESSIVPSDFGSVDDGHHGIENPVYFARSNVTEYIIADDLESMSDEYGCGGDSKSEIAGENDGPGMSNAGYFGQSEMSRYTTANPKPGRDCAGPEDELNDSEYGKEGLGISNSCYTASPKSIEPISSDIGGSDEACGVGVTNFGFHDENHFDAEETTL